VKGTPAFSRTLVARVSFAIPQPDFFFGNRISAVPVHIVVPF
jgi:hypothetical protein